MYSSSPTSPVAISPWLLSLTLLTAVPALALDAGGVHGGVYTPVVNNRIGQSDTAGGQSQYRLWIPQFEVALVNSVTNVTVATAKTNVFGRYLFRYQPAGSYKLCWSTAGWVAGCAPDKIVIKNNIFAVNAAAIRPALGAGNGAAPGAYWGRVRLTDSSSPYFVEEHFKINRTASITVTDLGGKTIGRTITNASGEYVLANMPPISQRTTAQVDAARITQIVPSSTVAVGAAAHLTLPNSRPILESVAAKLGGKGVREAPAGAQLELVSKVRDKDGDPLHYLWKPAPGAGQIVSTSNSSAIWQLANASGQQSVYLVVADDKGGYTTRSVTVTAGDGPVAFSGKVVTQLGVPIPGARIVINGTSFSGQGNGSFYARVKRSNRYVVNVYKTGYMPVSKVFDQSGLYTQYRLVTAKVQVFDPRQPVVIVSSRPDQTTPGANPLRPASIRLGAGVLVGKGGVPPVGMVTSYTATVNPANAEMPGDYGAGSPGADSNLISYGAVWAEFVDAAGNSVNVAPGKVAGIDVPTPNQMGPPPPSIALWSYNESTGYWDDLGLSAKFNPISNSYVGDVKHFSFVNTDISKADAACVRILLDNVDRNNLKARVQWVAGATPFVQQPEQVLGDSLNAFYRLPANSDVKIRVFDAITNSEIASARLLDANQQDLANNVVNTGAPNPDLWPPTPYEGCVTTAIRLDVPSGSISRIPFLSFYGVGSENEAVGYYRKLDSGLSYDSASQTYSGGTRSTLGAWWLQAGFGSDGSGGTRVAYMNHNDLGLGRDMHVRKAANGDVFAYVTNYGKADQNPLNASTAETADKEISGATVAMEYTPLTGITGKVVKFFVYSSGKSDGKLINSADLDGFGQKFVPNLCTTCHGGSPYYPADAASPTALEVSLRPSDISTVGASFREFDTDSFRYPGDVVTLPSALRPTFHALNQLVKDSSPQPAIVEIINGWYAGLASPTTDPPNMSFTPAAWTGSLAKENLYKQVVARSCRTCHVAFNSTNISWATYSQFQARRALIQSFVCGTPGAAAGAPDKYMPHALMTYRNFWLSTGPHRPTALAAFSESDWPLFNIPAGQTTGCE